MSAKIRTDRLNDPVIKYAGKNVIALPQDNTVAQAMSFLRNQNITDEIVYIYIVDDEQTLVGVLPLRKLLNSDNKDKLSDVMIKNVVYVHNYDSVIDACDKFLEHRFLALPVVDKDKKIEGVIDISLFTDEVSAFARKSEQDNIFQLIGIHLAHGRRLSLAGTFKDRFPWLIFNIVSGLMCAFIAGRYELLISQITILALFITIILALAESVSMQSMTITLQALSARKIYWKNLIKALRLEFIIALVLGLGGGISVGVIALLWKKQLVATVVIVLSIVFSMISACLLGIIIPALIRRLRIDPKIASGPIVLAVSDVVTLIFYFNIANWLLSH
ncbi:MAG: magnesium transporter [Planctomycetaceae bacterium]|nr:magnesium transporter [Planctomycetaceae bacterium]